MKRWLSRLLQVGVLLLPAFALYAWQTRDLLPQGARSPAPGLDLPLLPGGTFDGDALDGRPAVIYFFAPWCGVCAASAPQLRWYDRLLGEGAPLVLVALDYGSAGEVQAWLADHRIDAPVLLGDAATAAAFRIRGFPTYYVVDSEGRIAGHDFGFTTLPGLWWRTRWAG